MTRLLAALVSVAFWPCVSLAGQPAPSHAEPLGLTSNALALNDEEPDMRQVGGLHYLGGVRLEAAHKRFGGLSGLIVAEDESHALAITDRGAWVCLSLSQGESGRFGGVKDGWIAALKDVNGKPVAGRAMTDSEALALVPGGDAILVAFEGKHRVWRYRVPDPTDLCSAASSAAEPVSLPGGTRTLPANGGLEAMDALTPDTLMILSEQARQSDGGHLGWTLPISGLTATAATRVFYRPPDPYVPTDMARHGDTIYILNRHFSFFSGVSGALTRVSTADFLEPTGTVEPEVIARFAPPVAVDNFEALAVVGRKPFIYIASDDNFSVLQRTLLLKFSLKK